MQSTFRVDISPHTDGTDGEAVAKQPRVATRKSHRKSRAGCLACKQRRIKCNELKPSCSRCSRMNIKCEYSPAASPATGSSTSTISPREHSMAVEIAQKDLDEFLGYSKLSSPRQQSNGIRALSHFQQATCETFGGEVVNRVMRQVVAKDAWESPYLMHLVLAVSAGHQRRLFSAEGQVSRIRELEYAEVSHWNDGLQMYQVELARKNPPPGPARQDFDAMVAAMLLTIVFTFALEDGTARNHLVSGDNVFVQRVLNPMASTSGFKALQSMNDAPKDDSPWIPVFYAADDNVGSFTSDMQGIEGLPPAFTELCELDHSSTSQHNPYHKILRHLTPLLDMNLAPENMNKIFAFGGRLHATFRPLIMEKDVRGLLLLSWWLALLRQVDEWWVREWARASCKSLVQHLSNLRDPKLQALLVFPATFGTADFSWIWHEISG